MADIKNIDVFQTVTSVSFEVEPNTDIININKVTTSGYSGIPNLQEVTDIGATTTNGITITVGDGDGNGITSFSSQGYGIKGESNETYGVYGTSPSATGVYGTSDNGYGVQGYSESGIAVYGASQDNIGVKGNSVLGTAISAYSEYGTGLFAASETGVGVSATSNSIGLEVNGNGTIAIEANLGNSNKGLVINSGASSTGNFIELDKNGVDKLVVNQAGELTATKLIKQGGTSSQFLMADGSVSTGGGGGGATNLSTTQTVSNFTINSDTGDDAVVPLGNGTLAGATLNDYTTAEKNKLAAITGTNTGDQNLQSVTNIGATTTNTITANSITTTIDSTINGVRVGRGNISGTVSENTAVGYQALQSVIHTTGSTGYYNTAVGSGALKSLTTGYANDAFGDAALNLCTTGTFNLAIGIAAMLNSIDATQNTAVGQYALQNSISGQKNTAVGLSALGKNTTSYNTAIGSYAGGIVSSTGTENILVGYQAGGYISSGRNNLLIENVGSNASITSGSYNIILNPKQRSGVTTGSNNTIIGCFDNTFATGLTSNVILANGLGSIRFQSTDTGLTTVPAQTNTLINGDATGKAVVTKEYLTNSQTVFVPYTGATTDVNLGLNDITAAKLIKDGGFDYQFLKADGSVDNNIYLTSADLPSTLDLYATTTASDISGYTVLVRNIADTRYNATAQDVSTGVITSVGQLVGSLVTDANIISGNPGVFDFKTIGNISRTNGTGQAEFFFRIYKRNLAGTETLIAESDYTLPVTNGGYVEFSATALWNDGIFLDTDRVVLKYYANRLTSPVGSDPTYQFQFGGTSPVRSSAAIPTSVMPNIYLRDLADVENVDALNNEILYWNDPASLWEHSLAEDLVPLATATQKGLVSTTTQIFAGDKTFTGSIGIENSLVVSTNTDTAISAVSQDSNAISAEAVNGIGVYGSSVNGLGCYFNTVSGANIAEFRTDFVEKAKIDSGGIITGTGLNASEQTINTIASFDGSKNLVSLPTATYPSLAELALVKGVTSGIQSQFSGKQDTLQSTVNIKSINGNSILGSGDLTISASPASQSAYTMLANNTNASAIPTTQPFENLTNQVYSGTIVWTGGTAPSGTTDHTYSLSQIGNLVTLTINLAYGTAASSTVSSVTMELPSTAPTPALPSSVTTALDVVNYGSGMIISSKALATTAAAFCALRLKSTSPNVFEIVISRVASTHRYAYATIQYFV